MKHSNQRKNMVIAGTLTTLVLAVVLAFGGGRTTTESVKANLTPVEVTTTNNPVAVDAQYLQSLQAQNSELTNALHTMQAREQQYRTQIDLANQSIEQLQSQVTSTSYGGQYENEDNEEHEHEYEREHEEEDEHGYEENDD